MVDKPPAVAAMDADLLGHDPELASTVESLRRPPMGIEAEGPPSPRSPLPVVVPLRPAADVPSAFLLRALPIQGLLGRAIPWRAFGALTVLCVVGASAVAWGMVFLLRPSTFSSSSQARAADLRREPAPSRPAPVFATAALPTTAKACEDHARGARDDAARSPRTTKVVDSVPPRGRSGSSHIPEEGVLSATAPVELSALPQSEPAPSATSSSRKVWFE